MRIRKSITAAIGAAILSAALPFPVMAAGWQQNDSGWWYQREDSSYPAGAWEFIGGRWYLFDQKGYMLTGWQQVTGIWYYLGTDGAMASQTTMTIDGVAYTFDGSGAMVEQASETPALGRFEGPIFVNEWSNLRLTLPQGFVNLDSGAIPELSDSQAIVDMLSMKNGNCAVMVLYTPNKDGDAMGQMMSFLNMFHNGSMDMEETGRIDTVEAGCLRYLRFFFPASQEDQRTGYLYIRDMGSHYCIIVTVSDTGNLPEIDSILSTLTTAR